MDIMSDLVDELAQVIRNTPGDQPEREREREWSEYIAQALAPVIDAHVDSVLESRVLAIDARLGYPGLHPAAVAAYRRAQDIVREGCRS